MSGTDQANKQNNEYEMWRSTQRLPSLQAAFEAGEQAAYARGLQAGREQMREELYALERNFRIYRQAWLRELGGKLIRKSHEIDAFVLTTRWLYERAQKWIAYENGLAKRDPFWMVSSDEHLSGQGSSKPERTPVSPETKSIDPKI
jgi:hypothetical protein